MGKEAGWPSERRPQSRSSWNWKDKEWCPGGLADTQAMGIAWHPDREGDTLSEPWGLWKSPDLGRGVPRETVGGGPCRSEAQNPHCYPRQSWGSC